MLVANIICENRYQYSFTQTTWNSTRRHFFNSLIVSFQGRSLVRYSNTRTHRITTAVSTTDRLSECSCTSPTTQGPNVPLPSMHAPSILSTRSCHMPKQSDEYVDTSKGPSTKAFTYDRLKVNGCSTATLTQT